MDRRPLPLIPPPGTIWPTSFYRVFRILAAGVFRTALPVTLSGLEHLPSSGGVIVASNHLSLLDVPLLGYAIPRESRFPAKPELFANPLLARFLLSLGGFPIARGEGDRKALSFSEEVLRQGGVLGIFPEGTRSRNGELRPFHRGVALLAMGAGVPIVPAAIAGTDRSLPSGAGYPRFARLTVTFGPPEWPAPPSSDPVEKKSESLKLVARVHEGVRVLLAATQTGDGSPR